MGQERGKLTPELRAGDWTCATHGRITPRTDGVVPSCPQCGSGAYKVQIHPRGYPEYVESAPTHCAGPEPHRLGPGRVHLGWTSCHCPPVAAAHGGGHRTWTCSVCANVQEWPPHRPGEGHRT